MARGLKQELESVSQSRFSRRSAFEIRMDVLKVLAEGAERPTEIMYRANLSWIVLNKQLDALAKSEFVTSKMEGARTKFSATKKGVALLRSYRELLDQARITSEEGDK